VVISVRDTGIGIPPEAIPKVTLRYFTVGEQPSGSGLGLAISKEIVSLHGGHLDIESPPSGYDSGTRVSISLPTIAPPQVLIIDDDPSVCEFLRRQVESHGYRAHFLSSGDEAFEYVSKIRPDILVFDIAISGIDGIELILRVKDDAQLRRMGIIVETGAQLGRAKAEILRTLGIAVLKKPLDDDEFLECLTGMFLGSGKLVGFSMRPPASAT
jgi:CheY-like chemotaxis protein